MSDERATAVPKHEPGRCPWRPGQPCPPESWPGTRERMVLRMVAEGRTDAQIGKALGFAERTVSAWVGDLADRAGLPKAGFGTGRVRRTQLAVWAASHGHLEPVDEDPPTEGTPP